MRSWVTSGQRALLLAAVGSVLVVVALVSGIAPDLPGPRLRQTLGLADSQGPIEACVPQGGQDVTPDRPRPSAGEWREEPSLSFARDELRTAVLDGLIYLSNGNKGLEDESLVSSNAFSEFDPSSGRYRPLPETPKALDHAASMVAGGQVFIVGGASNGTPSSGLWRYSPDDRRWVELPPMSSARFSPAGAVIGDRFLYVTGGADGNDGEPFASVEVFDLARGRWLPAPDMPTPRHHHGAAVLDRKLYVAGGRRPGDFSLDSFERFDPERNEWEVLAPIPEGVGGPAVVATAEDVLVIAGGDDQGGGEVEPWVTRAVWAFDPDGESWRRLPNLRVPRHGHAAAVSDDRVYVFSGSPCPGYGMTSSVESLQLR